MTEVGEMLETAASYASSITCILAFVAVMVKPVREKIFGIGVVREGQRCLLRSEIVRIYYRHVEEKHLREYEYENLVHCYKAYKQLDGNSFVDHIYEEMQEWTVVR